MVERWINRLKQGRELAPRSVQRAANEWAMIVIAALVIWLNS
jgi:hypothetical protein